MQMGGQHQPALGCSHERFPMARWNGEPTLDIEIQRSCTLKHQDRPLLTT